MSLRKLMTQRTKFKMLNFKIVELVTKMKFNTLKTGLEYDVQTRMLDLKASSDLFLNE